MFDLARRDGTKLHKRVLGYDHRRIEQDMSWIVIRGRLRRDYRHIANKKAPNRALSGEQVAKATAEKVFGWKNVHNHEGTPTFTRQLDGLTIRT